MNLVEYDLKTSIDKKTIVKVSKENKFLFL